MITGLLIFSIITFIGVISYSRPKLEQRVIKNIPLHDWMYLLVVPIFATPAMLMIVNSIAMRPRVDILDLDDFSLLATGTMFLVYAFVGNGIHFVGKVLSRYITPRKHSIEYRVNEVFHGKLSHYMIFVCTLMLMFMMTLFEINHPAPYVVSVGVFNLLILFGLVTGVGATKVIFNTSAWYGGYNKPFFLLFVVLLTAILGIFERFQLDFSYYPVTIFFSCMFMTAISTFIIRQFLIFSRLNNKRKLRFLSKLFSAYR